MSNYRDWNDPETRAEFIEEEKHKIIAQLKYTASQIWHESKRLSEEDRLFFVPETGKCYTTDDVNAHPVVLREIEEKDFNK